MKTRMFGFITRTWNPLGGECKHGCIYCWARRLASKYMFNKYSGAARLYPKEFRYKFSKEDFVFVCDMCDLFGDWVPSDLIQRIIDFTNKSEARFLFLTKNPKRYKEFEFGDNCVLGATIETDYEKLCISAAPNRTERINEMADLGFAHKMLSVEPIMRFSPNFANEIARVKPEFVAVGYDNYHNGLPEPSLEMTEMLIGVLERRGITVYRKTLREKVGCLP